MLWTRYKFLFFVCWWTVIKSFPFVGLITDGTCASRWSIIWCWWVDGGNEGSGTIGLWLWLWLYDFLFLFFLLIINGELYKIYPRTNPSSLLADKWSKLHAFPSRAPSKERKKEKRTRRYHALSACKSNAFSNSVIAHLIANRHIWAVDACNISLRGEPRTRRRHAVQLRLIDRQENPEKWSGREGEKVLLYEDQVAVPTHRHFS